MIDAPEATSQTMIMEDTEARRVPSDENARAEIGPRPVYPVRTRVACGVYDLESQRHTWELSDPEAVIVPSGENVRDLTDLRWPSKIARGAPEIESHSRTVVSLLPVTICAPSAENATQLIQSEWSESSQAMTPL